MFKISRNNAEKCRIALSKTATKEEKFAAEELAEAIDAIFGYAPRVIRERKGLKNTIFVGETDAARKLYGDTYRTLAADETAVACDGANAYCFGRANAHTSAGSIYAAYDFLEKFLGVRYFATDETLYPARERLELDAFAPQRDKPDFDIRWYLAAETRLDPKFAVRRRIKDAYVPDLMGGGVYPKVESKQFHNFYEFVSPAEYREKHPQWFDDKAGQLCFSEEGIVDVVTEKLIRKIQENPQSVYFVVGQNDTTTPCGCERCKKQYAEYTETGALVRFVNKIARRVQCWQKNHCPERDIRVVTFAYYFGHRPPVVKTENGFSPIDASVVPEKNVYILFAAIDYCFYHKLEDASCEWNKEFTDIFRGWQSLVGERMMFWSYSTNYAHYFYPFWNFASLSANYKLLKDSKIEFVIDHGPCEGARMPLSELHTYVHSALLWRADADVDALVDEFVRGYYKECAEEVNAFFRLFSRRLEKEDKENGYHLRLYHLPREMFSKTLFDGETIASFSNALNAAYAKADAAGSAVLRRRVWQLEIAVLFLKYMNEKPSEEEAENFVKLCRECGVAKYKEDWRDGDYIEDLKELMLNGKTLEY